MKKTNKINKTILLSALTALAFGGIAISTTYALFTSEAETNVTVAAGKVDVKATLTDLVTYSGVNMTGDPTTDTLEETDVVGTFTNGGTASISGNTVVLDKLTPGDKVTFNVVIHNDSTVKSKYRSVAEIKEDNGLFDGLIIKIDDEQLGSTSVKSEYVDLAVGSEDITVKVSIELPSDATNIYEDKKCVFSYNVEAVQGNALTGIEVTPETIQSYLDGEHGSIDGKTLLLESGEYDCIDFSRATKYEGSNTDYYIGGIAEANKKTFEEFYEIKNSSSWSDSSYYVRNLNNVTIKAATGATVNINGLNAGAGHIYGSTTPVHDYVLDKDILNSAYYLAFNWSNIKFEGLNFTSKCDINSSQAETAIEGLTFKNCTFTLGSTTVTENQGLRFYTEGNTGKLKGLTVTNCTFNTCYQSIYTYHIADIDINNSTFNTTGHNAIAIQDNSVCNHKKVSITDNTFSDIGDRILRFGNLGADTQITIKGNKATNSGDDEKSVIKAQSLAEGITYDIEDNDWGEGTSVAQSEFEDK